MLFVTAFGFAQKGSVNSFKYVIVPKHYSWLSSPDQYKINSLTKFLLNKYGFKAFLDDETFPDDLGKNRCMALTANVKNNSGFFKTKNIVELRDCNNNVVFTSKEGTSKKKQYEKAFHEAIRKAFMSIKALNYKYDSTADVVVSNKPQTTTTKQEPVVVNYPTDTKPNTTVNKLKKEVLYAQQIANGYQLVNTKPEVVFQILKSTKKDFYFLKNKTGVLFKKGNNWIAEYYEGDKLIQKQLEIKF